MSFHTTQYDADLARVVTVPEVAHLWAVTTNAVRKWITFDRVVAVQRIPRSPWLISLDSVIAYAGPPVDVLPDERQGDPRGLG